MTGTEKGQRFGLNPSDLRCHLTVLLSPAMSQDVGLLHCYAYTRDGRRWFVGCPRTVEEGITIAEDALKDRRRLYLRAEVKDIRAGEVVWHSAPVLWPGGVR